MAPCETPSECRGGCRCVGVEVPLERHTRTRFGAARRHQTQLPSPAERGRQREQASKLGSMRDGREEAEEANAAGDLHVPGTRRGGKRGGYTNVGLDDEPHPASCATTARRSGLISAAADSDDTTGLVAAAITTTSATAGASKRRNKLSYVELGEGDSTPDTSDSSSSSSSSRGGGGGAAGAAAAASGEPEDKVSGRLAIFGLLNLGYVVLQLAGAMAFGSLALMSDGFHNLSDVAAIGMAMYIHRLQRRPISENEEDRLPFGYKRSEVIGGLINSVALIALSAYIILSAIPRLVVPQEVTDGWLYISLAFGGVVVNLVGVLFFWFPGEDGQSHDTHCGGFLAAHSHSHDHGHEAPVKLDSVGVLTLVDRYDVPPSAVSSSACGGDDGEEISVVLAGSDPIGRVSLNNTAVAREALLSSGNGGEEGHACSHSHGGHDHHANGGHRHGEDSHGDDACCSSSGGQNGDSHDHAHGHGHNDGLEMKKVHGKHGSAAVGGGCGGGGGGEGHGHEHHVHGHHHDDLESGGGGGGGCSHSDGHAHGGGGGCKGHHGKSMNLMAVLVHAIADAVSSGVVCAQGVIAFSFGTSGVDWTDYLDPLTSIALSLFIVYCALPVVKECAHVLLEGTPRGTDVPRLKKELLKVPGISTIQSLSVTQLNSEEPFVATVTVVAEPEVGGAEGLGNGGVGGAPQTARGGATALLEAVKRVLGNHNIGRNTVEVVLRHGNDAARGGGGGGGGATEGAPPNGNCERERGRQSSGVESDGCRHEAERGRGGGCNGSAGSHGRHSHGQCSGHGHSHAHSSTVVEMV